MADQDSAEIDKQAREWAQRTDEALLTGYARECVEGSVSSLLDILAHEVRPLFKRIHELEQAARKG